MVALNISARVTLLGFGVFTVAWIAWTIDGYLDGKTSLLIQNAALLLIDIAGTYRWLPKAEAGLRPTRSAHPSNGLARLCGKVPRRNRRGPDFCGNTDFVHNDRAGINGFDRSVVKVATAHRDLLLIINRSIHLTYPSTNTVKNISAVMPTAYWLQYEALST